MASILIVEDEPVLARELGRFLEDAGHSVRLAGTGREATAALAEAEPDVALLDLRLPDASGIDVLAQLQEQNPELAVVLMTAFGSVSDAVQAMKQGAADYLQKPLDLDELGLLIERLLSRRQQARELSYLRDRERVLPEGLVGGDRFSDLFEQVKRVAAAGLSPGERPSILITGETGTGKGMVAHAIHELLGGGPFVEVNCTAMPASLVEAELFGHERGAFTDARGARSGLFEAADGGTIFLDEIGDLDPTMQSKFLKVIEDKCVRRLGAVRDRKVDVQVIAATHRDLDQAERESRFRSDLLHRLRVLAFELPPLRERPEDLVAMAHHFAAELGRQYRRRPVKLAPDTLDSLRLYPWPGNVRELRNVLERAVLLAPQDILVAKDIEPLLRTKPGGTGTSRGFVLPAEGIELEALERDVLRQALERAGGNRTRAAALLGISRDTLRYRIEKFGLTDGDGPDEPT